MSLQPKTEAQRQPAPFCVCLLVQQCRITESNSDEDECLLQGSTNGDLDMHALCARKVRHAGAAGASSPSAMAWSVLFPGRPSFLTDTMISLVAIQVSLLWMIVRLGKKTEREGERGRIMNVRCGVSSHSPCHVVRCAACFCNVIPNLGACLVDTLHRALNND